MRTRDQRILTAFVAAHVLLVAAYTFPQELVPGRLQLIGQLYARPLFHQQWRLFAPDPPLCSCGVEWSADGTAWRKLGAGKDTYLNRRVQQAIARHAQALVQSGETTMNGPVAEAVLGVLRNENADSSSGAFPEGLRLRLVEQCVTDPIRPSVRVQRITDLRWP